MTTRILGIDYGSKRIGIALSDPLKIIAKGLTVVQNSSRAIGEIKRLAAEHDVELIVVGMPLNLKGEKGTKAVEVIKFIRELEHKTGLRVIEWDERFTSATAHQTLLEMRVTKKGRRSKETIDEMASALILQGYLDSIAKTVSQ